MSANRRYSRRRPVNFILYIHYRDKRVFKARAMDLCIDGMFIQTDSLTLPKGSLVDLEFSLSGIAWQVPAVVVHKTHRGLGVMFRKPQLALARCSHADDGAPPPSRQPQIVFPGGIRGETKHSGR